VIQVRSKLHLTVLSISLAMGSACALAAPGYQDKTPAPDNSANNKQHDVTADQQTNNPQDRDLARKIRRSLMGDKTLSTYGHNVKIIVVNGAVTIKGPVHSEDEKRQVGDLAAQVAGAEKVTNEVTVKP
jgi:hyperosmotically inducible periplasmic protein